MLLEQNDNIGYLYGVMMAEGDEVVLIATEMDGVDSVVAGDVVFG